MAKSSKVQIEEDENKLLFELMKNSKENIDVIAKNCRFSRQKAWRMIKKLEAKKLIWGYTAVVDEAKQGLQKFVLLIKRAMKEIDKETLNQLISYRTIKDIGKLGVTVENSYYTHGAYDWILIFTAPDVRQAKKFSEILISEYPSLVSNWNLVEVLMTLRSQNILNPDHMKLQKVIS